MYEVIGLKDFGTWLRKGVKCFCNDGLAIDLSRKGYLKVLKYHVTKVGRWHMEQSFKKLKEQRRALDMKIKGYEKYFNTLNPTKTEKQNG